MNEDETIGILMTMRGDRFHPLLHVEGSKQMRCPICQSSVIVSPSGVKFLEENPNAKMMCTTCGANDPELDDAPVKAVPGGLGDLALKMGRDEAESFVDSMEDLPFGLVKDLLDRGGKDET